MKGVLDQGDLQDVIPAIIEEQNIDLVVLELMAGGASANLFWALARKRFTALPPVPC